MVVENKAGAILVEKKAVAVHGVDHGFEGRVGVKVADAFGVDLGDGGNAVIADHGLGFGAFKQIPGEAALAEQPPGGEERLGHVGHTLWSGQNQ